MGRVTRSRTRKATESPAKKEEQAKVKAAPKKKVTAKKAKKEDKVEEKKKPAGAGKKVEVEACKQWGAFKTRANKILQAVGKKAVVEINKEKVGNILGKMAAIYF